MRSIGLPELPVILALGIFFLVPGVFYLITLQRALERCSLRARTLPPGRVWLLMIPFFNLVWQFMVVIHIALRCGTNL